MWKNNSRDKTNEIDAYSWNAAEQLLLKYYDTQYGTFYKDEDLIRKTVKEKLYKRLNKSFINGANEFEELIDYTSGY